MKFVKRAVPTLPILVQKCQKDLKKAKIKLVAVECDVLLSSALGKPKEFMYTHPEYQISAGEVKKFFVNIARRARHEPLAYITGAKEFYGFLFFVNKNVLIPRPETEELVDLALNELTSVKNFLLNQHSLDIIDVGAGSGAIIISLVKILQATNYPLQTRLFAIDSSKRALAIAQENAKHCGVAQNIQFLHGHLLGSYFKLIKNYNLPTTHYKLFLANLPYLTTSEMKKLQPEIRYEPPKALDGGKDGLDIYRSFFKQLSLLQNHSLTAICEIAPQQKKTLLKIIKASLPQSQVEFFKDAACRTRFALIKNLKSSG